MRDIASATAEVQQNCSRTRATVTREIRVALKADQRRAHRAPVHVPHRTNPIPLFVAAWTTSAQPTACQVGSADQRPSFGFLPSLILALHDSATPSRKPFHTLCGVEPAPPAEPKNSCLRQRVRARKFGLSSFAALVGTPPASRAACAPLPLHPGRHVPPASAFLVGVKADPATSPTVPRRGPCTAALRDLRDTWMSAEPFFACSSKSSFACNCHTCAHVPHCRVAVHPIPPE